LLGAAETSNPEKDEGLSNCISGNVRQRGCLRSTCVSVDGSETVPEAGGDRQRPDQVDVHMRETCRREVEIPERGFHMPRYHGKLTFCTSVCPSAAVLPTPACTNRWDINLTVTLAPWWLRPWRVSKTWRLKVVVIHGRGCGMDVSQ